MANLSFQSFFQLTLINFVFFLSTSCGSSLIQGEEEKTSCKDKLYLPERPNKTIDLEKGIGFPKINFISLEETSLEIVQKFPFITRKQKRYPKLNMAFSDNNLELLSYAEQLAATSSQINCRSLGDIMCHLKDAQKKFNVIECVFACTFQEIISYNKLFSSNTRVSDTSKITSIQKAMCLHQTPVIVALSSSNNINKKCCRILILYHFDDRTKNFMAQDILQLKDSAIPTITNVSYMIIQLQALEAWVGYNLTPVVSPKN